MAKTLKVHITADSAALERAFARSEKSGKKSMGGIEKSSAKATKTISKLEVATKGVGSALGKAAGVAVAAGAAYAGIGAAKQAISTTEDLAKATGGLHYNLGLSVKTASQWAVIAKARGLDNSKLSMAFKTLATQIASANSGSKASVKVFRQLGFNNDEIHRSLTDLNFALGETADGLKALPPGVTRTADAAKLFGRGWKDITPLLRDGSKAMNEQLSLANKYGATFSGKSLKSINDLISAQRELKIAQMGLQIQFTEKIAPALVMVGQRFAGFILHVERAKNADRAFRMVTKKLSAGVTFLTEHLGEQGPVLAGALVKGFMNAPIWGKLILGTLFLKKIGGLGSMLGIGRASGMKFAKGFIAGVLLLEMGKKLKEIAEGEKIDIPKPEAFLENLQENFPKANVVFGKTGVEFTESFGKLIFNPRTEKVISARGERLQRFLGKTLNRALIQDLATLEYNAERRTGNTVDAIRKGLAPLPRIGEGAGNRLRKALIPKLSDLVHDGDKKGREFKEKVGGQFNSLANTSRGAMESIVLDVQGLIRSLNLPKPKGFNVQKALESLPALPPMRYAGGPITRPMAIVGEEAPQHHEWVIATNPRYRENNVGYWMQAGHDLGIPGFAKGGPAHPRIVGPEPLRAVGQGAVDKVYRPASSLYNRLRSSFQGAAVSGYSGPPANMSQLGNNSWVDSHTLAVASLLAQKFGLSITSGYRSPGHNAAVGGVEGSLHTHGSSSNPGAIDFVPPSSRALAWATSHIAGLQEALIHDAGSGLHMHLGFFKKGGAMFSKKRQRGSKWPNINHRWSPHWAPDFGGPTLPFFEVAALAEWAGMPGVTMAQVAKGESGLRPGSAGVDPGGTKGYGLWAITSPFNDSLVRKYGGYEEMWNPVKNALAAAEIYRSQGLGAWYGTQYVTDENAHYGGKFNIKAVIGRGGKSGGAGGAKKAPPAPVGLGRGVAVGVPGLKPSTVSGAAASLPSNIQRLLRSPGLNYAGKVGISELALSQAESTPDHADDLAALAFQETLFQGNKTRILKALRTVDRELRKASTPRERKRLLERRNQLIEQLSSVESSLTGVGSARQGLNETDETGETSDIGAAMEELAKELKSSRELAESKVAVAAQVAERALTDIFARNLGGSAQLRAATAGTGNIGSSGRL